MASYSVEMLDAAGKAVTDAHCFDPDYGRTIARTALDAAMSLLPRGPRAEPEDSPLRRPWHTREHD